MPSCSPLMLPSAGILMLLGIFGGHLLQTEVETCQFEHPSSRLKLAPSHKPFFVPLEILHAGSQPTCQHSQRNPIQHLHFHVTASKPNARLRINQRNLDSDREC